MLFKHKEPILAICFFFLQSELFFSDFPQQVVDGNTDLTFVVTQPTFQVSQAHKGLNINGYTLPRGTQFLCLGKWKVSCSCLMEQVKINMFFFLIVIWHLDALCPVCLPIADCVNDSWTNCTCCSPAVALTVTAG